jgi:anti-sigma B factor antagonist
MEFTVTVTLDPPTARLQPVGELDIFTARQVADRLRSAVRSGCSTLVLDLSGVTFVDASALGVLDRARVALVADHGTLGMVAAPASFRRICELAGLGPAFGLN